MYTETAERCIAFDGHRCIAKGNILTTAAAVKSYIDERPESSVLIFDAGDSRIVEIDFRGTREEVIDRLKTRLGQSGAPLPEYPEPPRRAGRPKLGVIPREVTLLPRHWGWLEAQPGGASVALRRLVDEARKDNAGRERMRLAQEAAYRFMNAVAGDLPGFQEALRALYAGNAGRFAEETAAWPRDVREHARALATTALDAATPPTAG
ncbi:MAG: DUF2239 family protein [Bacteroidia bacterium]|nr:DUF2239 family protein [Bacteroidia bacterium]